ncbi:MAG: DUF1893 domain-containing protein [Candidatus Auribacterota bacterium]|nr:DUF1893 domain-containing protein [Candidatus Auribacterota bacterium]
MSKLQDKNGIFVYGETEISLILRDGEKVIFTSKKRGLRPLLECVVEWAGRVDNASLTDKVIGSAAARLIVRSEMIGTVTAGVISREALKHLSVHSIPVEWGKETDAILRDDGKGICPMEELSNRLPDDRDYFPALFQYFSMNMPGWLIPGKRT